MGFLPLFLRMDNRRCLVIGGGRVAARKVATLLAAGASVTVVSPELCPELEREVRIGRVDRIARAYQPGDLQGYSLVYAAVGSPQLARELYAEAQRLDIPINVADQPDFCSFIVPAVATRGRLQVAISTGGASPALASKLRARAESVFGPHLAPMAEILAAARGWLKCHEPQLGERSRKLRNLSNGDLEQALIAREREAIERALAAALEAPVSLADLGIDACAVIAPGDGAKAVRE